MHTGSKHQGFSVVIAAALLGLTSIAACNKGSEQAAPAAAEAEGAAKSAGGEAVEAGKDAGSDAVDTAKQKGREAVEDVPDTTK